MHRLCAYVVMRRAWTLLGLLEDLSRANYTAILTPDELRGGGRGDRYAVPVLKMILLLGGVADLKTQCGLALACIIMSQC